MKEGLKGGAPRLLSALLLALWAGCMLALSAIVAHGGPWEGTFPLDRPGILLAVGFSAVVGIGFGIDTSKITWEASIMS